MGLRETRRAETLGRIADHMLAHGLGVSTLRALAQAAGTSDRMLLYYFADKDDIVVAALGAICLRLGGALEAAMPPSRQAVPLVLGRLAAIARGPDLRPYMRIWLELATLAARGQEPFLGVAGHIADYFVGWVATRLDVDGDTERHVEAARIVALLDGIVLLDCVGRAGVSDLLLAESQKTVPC